MIRTRTVALVLFVALALALVPTSALAQVNLTHTVKVLYWSTNGTVTRTGSGNGTWNSSFYGIDYQGQSSSPWGLRLQFASGTQGSLGGSIGAFGAGTDSIYSIDATYLRPGETGFLRGFLGYGSISFSNNSSMFRSSGIRLGGDFTLPVSPHWSLSGGVAYYPSNATTVSGTIASGSASATATDYTISLQYAASNQIVVEGGYRTVSADSGPVGAGCPCNFGWSGFFLTVGRTFP